MKKHCVVKNAVLLGVSATLLLSACGTTPVTSDRASLQALEIPGEKVKMAEAGGSRGVWVVGSRGVWVVGDMASTVPGQNNTFSENLAEWNQIHLPQAQKLASRLGEGVKVAVIDTGIDLTHPAFTNSLLGSGTWRDFVDGDGIPQDEGSYDNDALVGYGHGTNVASIITQVAPKAKLMPIRVLGPDGTGEVANVVAAIDYAVSMDVDIINLSVGTQNSSAVDKAVERAAAAGVYVVSSSGNTGDQMVTAPARYAVDMNTAGNMSLSVGSVNSTDRKSSFSTYGSKLEVLAPGEGIMGAAPGGLTEAWSGTSMSAPIASGLVALAMGEMALGRRSKLLGKITMELARTADPVDAVNTVTLAGKLGKGRLNAERFIDAIVTSK